MESEKLLQVFPNPADGQITIKHPPSVKSSYLQLLDAAGKIVKEVVVPRMETRETMQLGALSAGIYQLLWVEEKRILRKTVVVVR